TSSQKRHEQHAYYERLKCLAQRPRLQPMGAGSSVVHRVWERLAARLRRWAGPGMAASRDWVSRLSTSRAPSSARVYSGPASGIETRWRYAHGAPTELPGGSIEQAARAAGSTALGGLTADPTA